MSKATWVELNKVLKQTTNEQQVLKMFEEEKARTPKRPQFMRRIWARYSRLRARREQRALLQGRVTKQR